MARLGVGAAFLVVPGAVLRPWVGRAAAEPVARMLARSVGARDLALGVGTLLALRHGQSPRGWLEAGMLSDVGDAVGIAAAARHLPPAGAVAGAAAALATAAAGRLIVAGLGGAGATADEPG